MALDLYLATQRFDLIDIERQVEEARARGLSVLHDGTDPVTLIACERPNVFSENRPKSSTGSIYESLESKDLIAVAGNALRGEVKLSGCSVSNCALARNGRGWTVKKETNNSLLDDRDARGRHLLEALYIRKSGLSGLELFPALEGVSVGKTLKSQMSFIPFYTFGELGIQGRLSVDDTKQQLSRLYTILENSLYCRKAATNQESYVEKVQRRILELIAKSRLGPVVERFLEQGATVNGKDCRPILEMLDGLRTIPSCKEILNNEDPRWCHGDLIPEDVLFSIPTEKFFLVDPNGQNSDPLVDLSKMAMSYLTVYDLAIRDWISCEVTLRTRRALVSFIVKDGFGKCRSEHEGLGEWICENGHRLISETSLRPWRSSPQAIMLLAGLQAMAISIFHALHHRRIDRAIYFLARGHLLTERAMCGLGI